MQTAVNLLLRRFGALAIALQRNIFRHAKLRLTVFYALVLFATLLTADAVTNYYRTSQVEATLATEISDHTTIANIMDVIRGTVNRARSADYMFYLLLTAVVTSASYFLAGKTLEPINRVLRSQRRFLANASHELKTPLSVMKAECENALHASATAGEMRQAIKHTIEEIDQMTGIINNLLFISHNTDDASRIPFIPIDIAEVVRRIMPTLERFAVERGVRLAVSHLEPALVRGNFIALEEVALNLARNAISYTPRGGAVTIALAKKRGRVECTVTDTGIGIPPDDLPHVFEPFFKSRKARIYEGEGSGLGLAITKEIVDLHGGLLEISSAPGQGTVVRLTLPAA